MGAGLLFFCGGGATAGIYLFMISDPLSGVIGIEDIGIRQPN